MGKHLIDVGKWVSAASADEQYKHLIDVGNCKLTQRDRWKTKEIPLTFPSSTRIQMTRDDCLEGNLQSDGSLHWSNGEVWRRPDRKSRILLKVCGDATGNVWNVVRRDGNLVASLDF